MKCNFIKYLVVSGLLSEVATAKFVGVPLRTQTPPKPSEEKAVCTKESNADNIAILAKNPITPEDIEMLFSLARMTDSLSKREEYRLERIAHLFRSMATSSYDIETLGDIVRQNEFSKTVRTNLSAALMLGKIDNNNTINEHDIGQLKRIALAANSLLPSLSRALYQNLKNAFNNTPRSLLDELRDIRAQLR